MEMDAVCRLRYVEAVPRGLLVALVAAAAMANGRRRGVLVPIRVRRARRRVLLEQSGMKMDAVGRRRYVEAIPRGLLVALVPAAAAAAMANGRRGVLVPVRGRRARRRVLLKHVGSAAAAVARLACACLWQW
jgi:hypothetical protein